LKFLFFLLFLVFLAGCTGNSILAECLTEKGFVMYGSEYCGYCQSQKEMFNGTFDKVNYVECTQETALCQEKNISAYPTWIYDGKQYMGRHSLEELASISGCTIN
jgi:hypothetical protein